MLKKSQQGERSEKKRKIKGKREMERAQGGRKKAWMEQRSEGESRWGAWEGAWGRRRCSDVFSPM